MCWFLNFYGNKLILPTLLPSAPLLKEVHFLYISIFWHFRDFPVGLDGKESACNARYLGSIPGSGKSAGEGHGYPLWCSCLENSMDRGA